MVSGDFGGRAGDITSKWIDDLDYRSEPRHVELANQHALVNSIRQGGIKTPLTITHWPSSAYGPATQELANGHHRLMAAMELGLTHVPVKRERA